MRACIVTTLCVMMLVVAPSIVQAQPQDVGGTDPAATTGIVPDCGADCNFDHLVLLVQNLINWMIYISVPIATVIFVFAGVKYVTAGGDPGKIRDAHKIFKNVAFGFVLILGAWLIVYTITSVFLEDDVPQLLEN